MHSAIFQNFNNSAAAPLSFTHLFATVFLFKLELFLQFFSKIHFWHFISKSSLTRRFHLSYILFINFLFSPDSIYIYIYSFYSPLSIFLAQIWWLFTDAFLIINYLTIAGMLLTVHVHFNKLEENEVEKMRLNWDMQELSLKESSLI